MKTSIPSPSTQQRGEEKNLARPAPFFEAYPWVKIFRNTNKYCKLTSAISCLFKIYLSGNLYQRMSKTLWEYLVINSSKNTFAALFLNRFLLNSFPHLWKSCLINSRNIIYSQNKQKLFSHIIHKARVFSLSHFPIIESECLFSFQWALLIARMWPQKHSQKVFVPFAIVWLIWIFMGKFRSSKKVLFDASVGQTTNISNLFI